MRIVQTILLALALLIFVAPAIYLIQVWPRMAPPGSGEADRARVEADSDGYRITLPSGASYRLARAEVIGSDKRSAAVAIVRSRLVDENASYRQSWARFWFLLGGACFVAMLFAIASQLIKTAESASAGITR